MSKAQIVPAIDIIGGRCVRLTKGEYSSVKTYDASPLDMALRYEDCGVTRIHLVDLDGAKQGCPANLRTLESIASRVGCETEWGGGISSSEALRSVFDAGAAKAIGGSVAALDMPLFHSWIQAFGPSRIILGADIKDGLVAVRGWQSTSALTLEELVDEYLADGLKELICTDISRDGMLSGPGADIYRSLEEKYPSLEVCVSGGISSMDDIRAMDTLGAARVIVGKAIYEGRITLEEIAEWSQNA